MTDYNQEYFYLKKSESRFPTVVNAKDSEGRMVELLREKPVDMGKTRILCFANPIPRNPELADFHNLVEPAPAVSKKLKTVLENFNLDGVQFLPTVIRDKANIEHPGYYIVHVHHLIDCMDKELSDWTPNEYAEGKASDVKKLVLDNQKLDEIPLEKRLVFAVGEKRTKVLYHISVVEKLLETSPTGMTIYRLSKWNPSQPFIDDYLNGR